jgi:AP2-associated kinase
MAKNTPDGKMDTPPTTANLSVPEDNPRKHRARRTSISDMVQRYEAIGGKSKGLGPGSPVIVPKSAGLKMSSSAASGRAVDITSTSPSSPLVSRFTASRISTPATEESGSGGAEARKPRPSAIDLARAALVGQDQSKTDSLKIRNAITGLPSGASGRLRPGSPVGRIGPLDGLPASPSFPPAKPAVPLEEPRPPSPEKPFQGVGKLIDQWQRKTEVESSRVHIPRRGSYTPKRAGLVSGGTGKDN